VAERGARRLERELAGVRVGFHCPPFGFESDPAARADIDGAIQAFGPAIYFCGFGFPKQEHLMAELSARYPESWFVGSGASLSFLAGETRRAPVWMQRSGLEWLFRLSQEPRRLFRRYIVDDIPFAVRMISAGAGTYLRRRMYQTRAGRLISTGSSKTP
jgi:N-acetylglucosaminyldiphosphoundecaprenol N-acetyl-beta-D-mannosaminyltransferase